MPGNDTAEKGCQFNFEIFDIEGKVGIPVHLEQ